MNFRWFEVKVVNLIKFLWAGTKDFYSLANFTPVKQVIAGLCFLTCVILATQWTPALWLLALAPVAFIQNMFFTLVSRSRNSQDTDYHRFCAWGSNGVWFVCQVMIVKNIWGAIHAGNWIYAILAGIVYSLATTEGSVLMMKKLIRDEKGKRRVGANEKIEGLETRIALLEKAQCCPIGCNTESLEARTKVLENIIVVGRNYPEGHPFRTDAIGKDSIETPSLETLTTKLDDTRFDKDTEKHIDTV